MEKVVYEQIKQWYNKKEQKRREKAKCIL